MNDQTTKLIKLWLDSEAGRDQIHRSAEQALTTLEAETGETREAIISRFLSQ